eukprot:5472559-Alexandrium_andersonii.AAC.1
MAHPPDARAPANANSGAAISVHAKVSGEAEIQGNGRYAQALCCTFHDARQLGLTRTKRDHLLRGGP